MNENDRPRIDWEEELRDINLSLPPPPETDLQPYSDYDWALIPEYLKKDWEEWLKEKDQDIVLEDMLKCGPIPASELKLINFTLDYARLRLFSSENSFNVKEERSLEKFGISFFRIHNMRSDDGLESHSAIIAGRSPLLKAELYNLGLTRIVEIANESLQFIDRPLIPPLNS